MAPRFLSPAEAVEDLLPSGSVLGVGGMHQTSAPMALIDQVVRRHLPIKRMITSPSASLQAELPIAAGLVSEIMSPYIGFEDLGLAPGFRRQVENGQLKVLECDEGSMTHALYAGAGGLGFIPAPPGVELTDIPKVNPEFYRPMTDPFSGAERLVIPAVRPDVVFIACAEADADGNVAFGRFPFTDRLMALAAKTLIVQVERIVDDLSTRAPGETIPAFLISAVVEAPGGCSPTAAPGFYERDLDAIKAYLKAAKTSEGLQAYLEERYGQ